MTRHPTPNQVHELFRTVRKMSGRAMAMEQQLQQAIRRDKTGTTTPDGYPRSTTGTISTSSDSTTESAAIALADGSIQRDRHHDLTVDACRALETAVEAWITLSARLASIDDATSETGPASRLCEHCTPALPKRSARKVHRRGTVGDRLTMAMDLCEPCYFFVQRSAPAGSHDGALPTPEQVAHHDRTGTWRMRAA